MTIEKIEEFNKGTDDLIFLWAKNKDIKKSTDKIMKKLMWEKNKKLMKY